MKSVPSQPEYAKDQPTAPTVRRVRRYRLAHKRIDYYPSHDVLDILLHHQSKRSDECIAGILDDLIRAGHRAVSGNGVKG